MSKYPLNVQKQESLPNEEPRHQAYFVIRKLLRTAGKVNEA